MPTSAFDLDAIADVVDDARPDESDDLVELLVDGGCAIDAPDDDRAAAHHEHRNHRDPTVHDPDPRLDERPADDGTTAPETTAPGTTPGTTTARRRPAPRRRVRTVEVDVGGIVSDQLPAGSGETPAEVAARYEIAGMIVPATPASVVSTYVSRGLNYGSTATASPASSTPSFPSPRSSSDSVRRSTRTGRYEFADSVTAADGSEGLSAQPAGDGPSWELEVSRSPTDDQLVEIRVARYDFGDSAERTVPDGLGRTLARQLALIDELGWQPENVGELRSYRDGTRCSATRR